MVALLRDGRRYIIGERIKDIVRLHAQLHTGSAAITLVEQLRAGRRTLIAERVRYVEALYASFRATAPATSATRQPQRPAESLRWQEKQLLKRARRCFSKLAATHHDQLWQKKRAFAAVPAPSVSPAAVPPAAPPSEPLTSGRQLDAALFALHARAPTAFRLLGCAFARRAIQRGVAPGWLQQPGAPVLIAAFHGAPDNGHFYSLWWKVESRELEVADKDPYADLQTT